MRPKKLSLLILLGVAANTVAAQQSSLPPQGTVAVSFRQPEPTPQPPAPGQPAPAAPAIPDTQPVPAGEVLPVPHAVPADNEAVALPPVHLLTLADFEGMALANNPSIARAAALVRAARGNYIQVGLPPNPSVGYEGQQIGSRGLAEQDGVFVSQEFVRGGKLRLNREVAAKQWAQAEHQLAAQQQRVLTDVRIAYSMVLIAQRQVDLANELLSVAKRTQQVADKLLLGKEVGRGDLVQAELEIGSAEILTNNAANRHMAAWRALAFSAGNPELALQRLDGEVDGPGIERTWEGTVERIISRSPEIGAAVANLEAARWSAQRAMVEKVPNLTVQGLYNFRDQGINGRPDGAIMVGLPLPIWDRNQGRVMQTQNEAAAASRALDQLELSLQQRLATVFERYRNAHFQVQQYRERILPKAQESLTLMQRLYQGGEATYISLLTAQRTYFQTNLNYLESLVTLKTTEAEIEGLLLSGSLENR